MGGLRALSGPALAIKKSCHRVRADHSAVPTLPRSNSSMRTLAIVLGLAFAVIAIVYWLVPAGSLPRVFPGFEAGSPRVHVKHGLAAAGAPRVLFAGAWDAGRSPAGGDGPGPGRTALPPPRGGDALERAEGERNQKADDRDHEQADIHLLDRKRAPGAPDQIAKPALCSHHFSHRDQHQADADAELEAGHDYRQRAGERDGPERVPAV